MTTRQVGDVTVVDTVGRITLGEGASTFRDTLRDLAAAGNKKLLLNLAEVSYIDSSGIGEMVSGFTSVTQSGRTGKTPESYQAREGPFSRSPNYSTSFRGVRRRSPRGP